VIPLALYVLSLDPDVGFWDTGEMNTVPYILGLAHPTGYPTEILFGWAFAHAFAVGEVSFRLSLLNALEIAGAACLACWFVLTETGEALLGLFAAIAFATVLSVWQHATHTDVMSLTVLLTSAVFVLVRSWWTTGRPAFLLCAAAVGAADAGTHGAALLYLAVPAAVVLVRAIRHRDVRATSAVACAVFAITAACLYAYLPLRSAYVASNGLEPALALGLPPGRPFWNWGDPRTASGFFDVITGSGVGAAHSFVSYIQPAFFAASLWQGFGKLEAALGPLLLATVLGLCAFATARQWKVATFLWAPAVVVSPFIAHFQAESDPSRYYIFPLWGLSIATSLGVHQVLAAIRLAADRRAAFLGALLVAFGAAQIFEGVRSSCSDTTSWASTISTPRSRVRRPHRSSSHRGRTLRRWRTPPILNTR
jgi:hypothetical protein